MKRNRIFTNKYLLLSVVLIAMLALSGCRTRITNNSEVSNVKYDEDGFLTETYQMRRDELGLSIAEKPLLPDLGSPEDEEESSEPEIEENLNVVQEEDTYVEPPTTTEARNNATTNRTTTTRRVSRTDSDDDAEKVTIIFDANNGTINGKEALSVDVKEGSTYSTPPTPTREGYTGFIGWFDEPEEGKGKQITFPIKVEEDMYLFAHWGDITVIFDANGGKVEGQDQFTDSVKKGSGLKFPNTPTLKNNTFKGWHTDPDKESPVAEGTPVDKNTTYYAHWEVDNSNTEWVVTFDANGGNFGGNKTEIQVKVKNGASAKVPEKNPVKEGSEFKGWDGTLENITSNTRVKAIWETITIMHTVTFDSNGGTKVDSQEIENGKKLTLPKGPTKDGYKFIGWQVGDNILEAGESIDVKENMEIIAQWEGDVSSVKYWNEQFSEVVKDINNPKCYLDGTAFESTLKACGVSEIVSGETTDTDYEYIIVFAKESEKEEKITTYTTDAKYTGKEILILSDSTDDKIDIVRKFAMLYFLPEGEIPDYKEIANGLGIKEEDLKTIIYYPENL